MGFFSPGLVRASGVHSDSVWFVYMHSHIHSQAGKRRSRKVCVDVTFIPFIKLTVKSLW